MGSITIAPGAAPTTTFAGEIYFDNTTGELYYRNTSNNEWISLSGMCGEIKTYAGATEPSGWVFCDGSVYDGTDSTYEKLFNVIGVNYGGSGTNFAVPDMRGRVAISPDNMGGGVAGRVTNEPANMASTGGFEDHALTLSELPTHNHTATASGTQSISEANHTHGYSNPTTVSASFSPIGGQADSITGTSSHTTGAAGGWTKSVDFSNASLSVADTGGGAAHTSMQPYICINHIIKL